MGMRLPLFQYNLVPENQHKIRVHLVLGCDLYTDEHGMQKTQRLADANILRCPLLMRDVENDLSKITDKQLVEVTVHGDQLTTVSLLSLPFAFCARSYI